MNHDDAVAIQQTMCGLTDDPDAYRKPPMQALIDACTAARYGTGDDGDGVEWGPF